MSSSFDELFDKNKEKMSKSRFQDDDLDDFMTSRRPSRSRISRDDYYYDDYDRHDRYRYNRHDRRDRPVIIDKRNRNNRYDRRYIDNDIEVYRNEDNYIAHHQRGRGGSTLFVFGNSRRTYYDDGTYYDDKTGSGRWLEEGETDDVGKLLKFVTITLFILTFLFGIVYALTSYNFLVVLFIVSLVSVFVVSAVDGLRKTMMVKKLEEKQRNM